MLDSKHAYLFTEITALIMIYTFTSPFVNWKIFFHKAILIRSAIMFVLWILIDQVAVSLSIWSFSNDNSFVALILNLPVEEYILFILHSIFCVVFIEMYKSK